jgi:sugar phosphate isomerase/epimerase
MELGVLTVLYQNKDLEEMLDTIQKYGVNVVELGTGNFTSDVHCKPKELLEDENKFLEFKEKLEKRNIKISALSCHGNPLHPNKKIAESNHQIWRKTVLLAEKLSVNTVVTFSGCPGGSEGDKFPNWITCPWPQDFSEMLKWQWEEKVIPYWKEEVEFAKSHRVDKIALEMHPNFVVYNPETLIKLREAVGKVIGANFDPSHLIWQGIDPIQAIRVLGQEKAIYHFHAKDLYIDRHNVEINGILDTKPYSDILNRSWTFRTIGYGNGYKYWKDIISMLRIVGYEGVISIEHEDALASIDEGFSKAVNFLKEVIFEEQPGEIWWA